MPSVEGRERTTVVGLLVASATASGAAAGAALGLVVGALASVTGALFRSPLDVGLAVVAMVAAALAIDMITLATGRPRPPSVGRQVPQEWTRLLDAPVVAVLFGARLGIGPLTILSTWSWWSAMVAAGLLGVGQAVAVGATFGFVRLVVTVGVSLAAESSDGDRARWFGRLRSNQRHGWSALLGLGALAVASAAVAGCSGAQASAQPERPEPTVTTSPPTSSPTTTPARLEDFVRTPTPAPAVDLDHSTAPPSPATASTSEADVPAETPGDDVPADPLSVALIAEIDGFTAIDEPGADRSLDLDAAAAVQPDPTEEIALLETRGFRGGWTRAFRSAENDVAVASIYEFADAEEAEFYLEDGLITIGGYGGSFFDIEGLPAVRGFAQSFDDEGEELLSLGAAFQRGARWYLVYIVGSPETVTPDVLIPTVAAQLDLTG